MQGLSVGFSFGNSRSKSIDWSSISMYKPLALTSNHPFIEG